MSDSSFIFIEATPTFQRNLRRLAKKYPKIRNDLEPIIQQLQQGEIPGDRMAGIGYEVFKLRVRNSDIQKGKSGGYRLIYYLKTTTAIVLLAMYSKSEQISISAPEIQQIIADYNNI